jgi:hypothetical protein
MEWIVARLVGKQLFGKVIGKAGARLIVYGGLVLAVCLAIFLAVRWHNGRIEDLKTTSFNAGYAKAVDDGKKGVAKVEHVSTAIATEIRSKTDEKIRDSGRHADALRVRGPAAAACIDPRLSAGAGGHDATGGGSGPAVPGLPDQERPELIAVPFDVAVNRAEVDDANRLEVLAWREWHKRLTDTWAQYQAELERS